MQLIGCTYINLDHVEQVHRTDSGCTIRYVSGGCFDLVGEDAQKLLEAVMSPEEKAAASKAKAEQEAKAKAEADKAAKAKVVAEKAQKAADEASAKVQAETSK